MDYNEFLETVLKKRTKRFAKIRGSWGVYDAYKLIRKHGWFDIGRPVKEHEFYSIIRGVNKLLADDFANHGNTIKFPHSMGKIEARKQKRGVFFDKEGRLVNTYPICWSDTMRLWYEDKEAMRDKVLIRKDRKYVPIVFYNRYHATYKNQYFYAFTPNRFMGRTFFKNVIKGKIDTLW